MPDEVLSDEDLRRLIDVRRLRRLLDVGRSLVSQLDLEAVLKRVLEEARDLTGARYAALGILDPDHKGLDRFITLGVDDETQARIGHLPEGHGVLGVLISDPRPLRLGDVSGHPRSFGFPAHHPPMRTFLGVPITVRGQAWGNLYLTEKRGDDEFDELDEESAVVLADWAAIAIANAHSVAEDRLRRTMEASERERRHWARELHDETLQGLGALRVLLASALRRGSPEALNGAVGEAVDQLAGEIDKLRALITELRPAALDELGLVAAIEALAERSSLTAGLQIHSDLALEGGGSGARLSPELESTVYRLVQEALTNVVKHARAERVDLRVVEENGRIELSVRDDGVGFDPAARAPGFGLVGMRERLAMVGGTLQIDSSPGKGTELHAELPLSRP
ncbi:MAG TPA: GAF domain-containing sensor histidine kinase [Solirubrobacterales bacterium]|nr:GAF domain-containing sensor histidine kinase [Solirubrobacterales bacterium]